MALAKTITLTEAMAQIQPLSHAAMAEAQARWGRIAKPLNSLGRLEKTVIQLAGITGNHQVAIDRRCVVIMCADNGVVAEGVTQTDQHITALVAKNLTEGASCVCHMADRAQVDVIPVDIGVSVDLPYRGILQHKIAAGTGNIAQGAAMSTAQAVAALEVGINLVATLKDQGYQLIATGEMGIGNTTTSSAMAAVLLQKPVEDVTGRGAGLSSAGLARKIAVIKQAIACNQPNATDPLAILAKLGGFDLAGMAGLFLGGAALGVPVVVDGFISAVAALTAVRLCPAMAGYPVASHVSKEPAGQMVLEALALKPLLSCEMCMGEGTGAVAMLPVLDMACAIYQNMSSFDDIQMESYQPLD